MKTPSGNSTNWTKNTINSILTNGKYKGDALLQKTFAANYLDHVLMRNIGQGLQYYVENNHPAIIDKDTWEQVQMEVKRRSTLGLASSASNVFSTKLICEDCAGFYGKKKWYSNTKYSRFVYQCNRKFNKDKCQTPHLTEEDIKLKFIEAYNIAMFDKERMVDDTKEVIGLLTDTQVLDADITRLSDALTVIRELVNKLVNENSKTSITLSDYNKKYEELNNKYEIATTKYNELVEQKNYKDAQAIKMNSFYINLLNSKNRLSMWNDKVWMLMVESAIIHRDRSIKFMFYNGK